MGVKYNDLKEILINKIKELASNNDKVEQIKAYMEQFDIPFGEIGKIFNNVNVLEDTDIRVIALLTEAIFEVDRDNDLNPIQYFTEFEMKDAHSFSGESIIEKDEMVLPLKLQNATKISESVYFITLTAKQINSLRKKVLVYNMETQRETTKIKNKEKDKTNKKPNEKDFFEVPTLNKESVEDIANCLLTGTLYPTTLTFNARVKTSDSGDEILYNEKTKELVITKGTVLDIIDGFHRIMGIMTALIKNKDIDMIFPVLLVNFSIPNAQKYLAQISKTNPISKARIEELSKEKYSATVIEELKNLSSLKGKISQTDRVNRGVGELVSYLTLAEAIDEEFKMRNKSQAMDVAEYLVDFFDYLIGRYEEVFITNHDTNRKTTLMNHNIMFVGYVTLAARMFENKENVRNLKKYIDTINFDRDNEEWQLMKLIFNNTVNFRKSAKNKLKKYFNDVYKNNN